VLNLVLPLLTAAVAAAPTPGGEVLFVVGPSRGGPGRHEHFADASLLADLVRRVPGLAPKVIREGWPSDEALAHARSLVLLCDAGPDHLLNKPERLDAVQRFVDAQKGLVVIHSALQGPDQANERLGAWLGGRFDSTSRAGRPGWIAGFHHFPDHPVARGMTPFSLEEQWYFGLRFVPGLTGVVPLLEDVPPPHLLNGLPPVSAILAWTYARPQGGRSFVITGPHDHDSLGVEGLRRLIANAIIWVSGLEVPAAGSSVAIGPDALRRNLTNPAPVYQGEERGPPPPAPATARPAASLASAPAAIPAKGLPGGMSPPAKTNSVVFRRPPTPGRP